MIVIIKQLLFGVTRESQEPFIEGVHTVFPTRLSFNDWCQELNVSSRYEKKYQ